MVEEIDFDMDRLAVVVRPGLRLAEVVVRTRVVTALARAKRKTMTDITRTLVAGAHGARVTSVDQDGSRWSISVAPSAVGCAAGPVPGGIRP